MIFALILTHGQLVSLARLRSCHLHPADLYLMINLVNSTEAFKGVESWVPVCLPRLDPRFARHSVNPLPLTSVSLQRLPLCAHLLLGRRLSSLSPSSHYKLRPLSNSVELQTNDRRGKTQSRPNETRSSILHQKLLKYNLIKQIHLAVDKDHCLAQEMACKELRYFAYKSRGLSQYIASKLSSPYTNQERLFEMIRYVYGHLHNPNHRLKLIYHTTEHESLLGWVRRTTRSALSKPDRSVSVDSRLRTARGIHTAGDLEHRAQLRGSPAHIHQARRGAIVHPHLRMHLILLCVFALRLSLFISLIAFHSLPIVSSLEDSLNTLSVRCKCSTTKKGRKISRTDKGQGR